MCPFEVGPFAGAYYKKDARAVSFLGGHMARGAEEKNSRKLFVRAQKATGSGERAIDDAKPL